MKLGNIWVKPVYFLEKLGIIPLPSLEEQNSISLDQKSTESKDRKSPDLFLSTHIRDGNSI
ncbi:hypothetical protein KAM398_01570 [Acinetobacter sp. KAM398]|jgi:hypothetical protein|uniref:Uncharacterized protein n=1 Tax=Acinetobacter towneri TaxID=202956 RepID=A0A1E8E4A9_9GAMM|nr:hypothetical protein C3Y93_00350 [Acinetobacter sp. SWBY1]OFE44462.1 hypothetical protein BJN41_07995 [Acinetobacter towneri]PCN61440.1 hypothetical protein CF596_02285 [Acinetobacter sp. YT-02]GIT84226.1 hypothetical protein DSM16313_20080 [Acinetobacter seohaensis]GJC30178.1 hypothetical protein KAM392_01570 [Acinetobacter sp. KAM392]GJC32988.1 hypothetical protein KAM393_01570 [Acinetobacter sp. KAM393]GJC35817.1 hypothetical protein KAM394_01570 [Acinetobacter sp. KAM394]GJC38608.1 hy